MIVPLHVQTYGEHGSPVVILHGLLGSQRNWRSMALALATEHRIYAVDLRNHGQSPHAPQMDYAHLTADVTSLIRDLDVGRVHLLGHSLGGKVAMCVALAEPDLVESIIVVDMAPTTYPDHNAGILRSLLGLPLDTVTDRAGADRWLTAHIAEPSLRQFLLTNLSQTAHGLAWLPNLKALARAGPELSGFPEFRPELAFPGPALFIFGALSPYAVPDRKDIADTLFPAARYTALDGCSHWPHIEKPQEFLAVLRAFLAAG